jgi:hypothetical protein
MRHKRIQSVIDTIKGRKPGNPLAPFLDELWRPAFHFGMESSPRSTG